MGETDGPTLESQFKEFAKKMDSDRDGTTINLSNSDFWLRQSKVLEDRQLTMTDTGKLFFEKFRLLWVLIILLSIVQLLIVASQEAIGTTYCNATWDSFLCWPPTAAGAVATQSCPPARLSDVNREAFRTCGEEGVWLNKQGNIGNPIGWTNYTPCFPPEVQTLFVKFYEKQNEKDAHLKFEIAQWTRYMEIVGFCLSLVFLVMSLVIFTHYRSLRNNRTRIHKNLFSAMTMQVLLRLILYFDQAFIRNSDGQSTYDDVMLRGIENIPYLCEGCYLLLEYASSVMFDWMFIEGLYLHNVVTANALRERNSHLLYYAIGYGLPFINILIWAVANAYQYSENPVMRCWYGYNFQELYWILQVPRMAIMLCNFFFLLNIMRVLILKLNQSENTELEKVRKAVRAALVLLPLLGLTNGLNMTEAPLDGEVWQFAIWSYTTHFLRSFQGFFIALIYCFLNGEVRKVLRKSYDDYMAMHPDAQRHRDSLFNFLSSSGEHRDQRILHRVPTPSKPSWMVLRKQSADAAVEPKTDLELRPITRPPEVKIDSPDDPDDQMLSLATPENFATPEECPTPEGYAETVVDVDIEVAPCVRDSGVSVELEQDDDEEDD
ncbi:hypothetical protein O0L34_g2813 [Tuta absoluta]|nr:hypothetical protein O0L34_g2813 [Tuta absoluta]